MLGRIHLWRPCRTFATGCLKGLARLDSGAAFDFFMPSAIEAHANKKKESKLAKVT